MMVVHPEVNLVVLRNESRLGHNIEEDCHPKVLNYLRLRVKWKNH